MISGPSRRGISIAAVALACAFLPAIALAFPGTDPSEPRLEAPNDPDFDPCEADDAETPGLDCTSYFSEDYRLFGFSPDSANQVPDQVGILPHHVTGTRYSNCDQLDAAGRQANLNAEGLDESDPDADLARCLQIGGVRADSAWKYSTGDPDVAVAILDTGIRWQEPELVDKVRLNAGELPPPQDGPDPCADDCNGDGAFSVTDYAADPRVAPDAGDDEADAILDASDLIATFSGDGDTDSNGYADDIAGWDFFDDDNDPFDASSCCSASGHGTGRALEALAETDNATDSPGLCPECQLIPLRVWDSFVVPGDNYAMGVVYATSNGASVVEGAVGGLTNTRFARSAFEYADAHGVALTLVSSDINSANHNYPTNYNEAIYVGGSIPDTAPNETCSGPGGLPGFGDVLAPPEDFADGCAQLQSLLGNISGCPDGPLCVDPSTQPPTTSFFRNSNLTQYGGKADIVLMGATGSENTGQASGAAGLLASFGRETFGASDPLTGNEIRQLLTMTAEDVLPENTGAIGAPDKANPGWDPHFGYGRVNLPAAMERIADDRVPPEAQIDSPDWFAPIDVDRVPAAGVEVTGLAAAPHSAAGVGDWELEYACGQDALDTDFAANPPLATGTGEVDHGLLGVIPRDTLVELAAGCDGSVEDDFGRPSGDAASEPGDPYPDPDPERHAFQLRLTVHEAGDSDNFGRYRKTLFAYEDDGNLAGWPRPVGSGSDAARYRTGSGGEVSPRLYDVDGDNRLDVIQPTSSGELLALHADGSPVESFNGGAPVTTDPNALAAAHALPDGLPPPRESLRVPAIGDVDGDREAEIVATAGEHVYVWALDGERERKLRLDPALSEPCVDDADEPCFDPDDRAITEDNHIKRGFFGSPALADLDGDDTLDIVAAAMDQHLYAFRGDGAGQLPGFPVKLASAGAAGAEIITTPAIADLDGDDDPEVVIATNEVVPGDPQPPGTIFDVLNAFVGSSTGSNPVYAVDGDGSMVENWPVPVGVLAGDLLPLVLPGHDAAVLDADADGDDEVSVSAATSLAGQGTRLVDGDGATLSTYENAVADSPDQGPVVNLADYQSIGDLAGAGSPAVIKGGVTLNGVANLLAVNQNLPFSHVEQAWDPTTGEALTGYPLATDDFQLVSQASVARVAGDGPGAHALVGTGLYNLHAYGADGSEAPGWPKFTGGWQQATPAVGDMDGDGALDVTTLTREGWSFAWGTGVDACDSSNEEWWTFHHDERSTANYGADGRPPGTVRELEAVARGGGAVELRWTAPGDDWLCGRADRFRVVLAAGEISSPGDGQQAIEVDAAAASGEPESVSLSAADVAGATRAAVLYRDEAGNWGLLKSVGLPPPTGGCSNQIAGTKNKDSINGTPGSDRIRGRGGDDRLRGRGGDDCVSGQAGADRVAGGGGGDLLKGGRGHDRLKGGGGRDVIRVRRGGRDRVSCGPGRDKVFYTPGKDRVRGCEVKRKR
jgi:Ca2+-binding RTX toxin-like protein